MAEKKHKKIQLISMVHPDLRRRLQTEADEQDISLSHLVRRILEAHKTGKLK